MDGSRIVMIPDVLYTEALEMAFLRIWLQLNVSCLFSLLCDIDFNHVTRPQDLYVA